MRKEVIETIGRSRPRDARDTDGRSSVEVSKSKSHWVTACAVAQPTAAQTHNRPRITTALEEIRAWAEARGGRPAAVKAPLRRNEADLLRIDFPGHAGKNILQLVSWNEWFRKFEENRLALLYQEKTRSGKQSRFFKLIKR